MNGQTNLKSEPQPVCVDGEALKTWLDLAVVGLIPAGFEAYIIPRTTDAKGESKFFCSIDVEEPITVETLVKREVAEHSRGPYLHFYADDVVSAACGAGVLNATYVWLFYRW